jgi:hypothetical protein
MLFSDLTRQATLITGRILHQGTRLPIVGKVRITAGEATIVDKVLEDGTFVLSAPVDLSFPELSSRSYSLNLTIHAESAQFRLGTVKYSCLVTIPAGSNFDPELATTPPDPLIDLGTIYLPVNPVDDPTAAPDVYRENLQVNIRGRVIQANLPEIPFQTPPTIQVVPTGAVSVLVMADADGRYRLTEVLVRSPAQIRCSADGFQTIDRRLSIDFGKVFNQQNFRLVPLP